MLSKVASHTAVNVSLRLASLAGRFALTIYVAAVLGAQDLGRFGLLLGAVAAFPAISGLGLNYFMAREVVAEPSSRATIIVRDRLLVSATTAIALVGGAALGSAAGAIDLGHMPWAAVGIVFLEVLLFDFHYALIGRDRATLANVIIALKGAVWVPLVVIAGLVWPQFRSLDFVLYVWLATLILTVGWLVSRTSRTDIRALVKAPIDKVWIRDRLSGAGLIYVSDIGIVAMSYADRFVISDTLGLRAVGIFTVFWSFSNALHTLLQTGLLQASLPKLVRLHKEREEAQWRSTLASTQRKLLASGVLLSLAVYLIMILLLPPLGVEEVEGLYLLPALLLASALIRALSDLYHQALYSRLRDYAANSVNLLGLVVAPSFALVGAHTLGLNGVGAAAVASTILILGVRRMVLARSLSRGDAIGTGSV